MRIGQWLNREVVSKAGKWFNPILAGALTATLAAALIWILNIPTPSPESSPSAAAPSPPTSALSAPKSSIPQLPWIGDPRTVDPCGLVDAASLGQFGRAHVDPDVGNFSRCDVFIDVPGQPRVDVKLEFWIEGAPLLIKQKSSSGNECVRRVELAGPVILTITANTTIRAAVDLCAIADVAKAFTIGKLDSGEIPRRPWPIRNGSLANENACEFLNRNTLARLPGIDAGNPQADYAAWECRWVNSDDILSLRIRFDQGDPLRGTKGRYTKLGERDALVESNGDGKGTCKVTVSYLPYFDSDHEAAFEMVLITVYGRRPAYQLCRMAEEIAKDLP